MSVSLKRRILRRFIRNKSGLVGLVLLSIVVGMAVLADYLAPHDPLEQDIINRLKPPSLEHPMGTDEFGRDVFSRVVYGARISLMVGLVTVALATAVGVPLGLVSGYFGGLPDNTIMRAMDVLLAFPGYLLALAVVSILGPSLMNAMIAVAIFLIPVYARTVRGIVLSVKNLEYVEAARIMGASHLAIIKDHILLNVIPEVLVLSTFNIANSILIASALSFLGLGAQPPTPEWGAMVSSSRHYLMIAPWASLFPGTMILIAVLAFNLVGDALNDALRPY